MQITDLYIKHGFYLFPVQKNKIPYAKFPWRELSTRDPIQWKMWSEEFEGCSWAIDCGKSGLVVIDIDPRNGGSCEKFDPFKTWKVKTPSGGFHFYFKGKAPCSKPWPGIDIKAEGGYVLAPPSAKYELLFSETILDLPLEIMPIGEVKEKFSVPGKIKDGTRDETLFKAACSLIGQNQPPEVIEETLYATNLRICEPPLDRRQVQKIIKSAEGKRKPASPLSESKGKGKKIVYEDFKNYFHSVYSERRFCPIKQELFVRTNYGAWENALAQESILKSISHENGLSHSVLKDHLIHWGSLKERGLHENKMLVDIPAWDGVGRIVKFYQALPVKNINREHGFQLFKHYLANTWRRIEDPKNRNWALILVGDQNMGKDWWIRELLGAWDTKYYYENLNVFDDEIRTFMQIDGKIIINISEFDNTKKWDSAFLKDLITKEDLSYIGKYKAAPKHNEARHSIIASANKMDFLQDYTGSTRFLIFDISHDKIDWQAYPRGESLQVIAESRALFEAGYVASEDALKSLVDYQDSVTPENVPEMIKTDFNAMLTLKDSAGSFTGEPRFWTVADLEDEFEAIGKRYQKSRRQLFDLLKPDFGCGNSYKKGYKRRIQ